MTQDTLIDRLEATMERVLVELTENRQDMRDLRREMDSKFRTLLFVNFGSWMTTIGAIIGLFFKA